MTRLLCFLHDIAQLACTLLAFLIDVMRFLGLCLRSPAALAAENLFLRKQLALYQERHVKPKRVTPATRLTRVWLARWFDWRQALGHRPARDIDPLASPWVSPVLALEVSTPGRPPIPPASASTHPSDSP